MKNFFKSTGAFIRAFPHFMFFELIFRLILIAIGAPFLMFLLKLTMKISGIKYLSDESLLVYLKNPVTALIIIIMLFILALFTFVELSALVGCFSCYLKKEKISVGGMFITGINAFRKAFRGTGILSFMFFMIFMPMAQFTLSSGVFLAPFIPILQNIFKSLNSNLAVIAYILIQVLFVLIIVNKIYSLHFLILTDRKFMDCTAQSKKLIKDNKLETAFSLILWSIFMIAVAVTATFIIGFLVTYGIKGFSHPKKALFSAWNILKYAVQIFSAISAFISSPAIMCWLTGKFFAEIDENEKITLPDRNRKKMNKLPKAIIITSVTAVAVLLNFSYIQSLYRGNINLNVGILTKTQITAHRGFSKVAPENTLYAFQSAIDSGADYIELDVQLTKDNQLVVFHDEKLDRTTDGTGILSNYTYAELQKLSAGSWFSDTGEFDDAKICLLSDVLELVGKDIMLNIEIKNHGDYKTTVDKTVELIEEYDIVDSCYVTSFSYSAIKRVKKINPKIKTGIIANVATTTSLTQLKYIDALSMNYIFVNQTVVNSAHQNGKRIFVWTVDNASSIKNMMSLGVDNIITNRPDKASEIIYSNSISEKVLTILKTVFG